MASASFEPHRLVRNPHVQSVLASAKLRRLALWARGRTAMRESAREILLDCGDGVRLQAFHSPATDARGTVILLHGWEGCTESNYLLATGEALHAAGWDVVRLNLRDHGDTHRLNPDVFHANRIDEVVGAVGAITATAPARPLVFVGFSLGGNFALRVALRAPAAGLPLDRVVAVNPAIEPAKVCDAIDGSPFYRTYFMRKWRRSLARKAAAFPHRYDFTDAGRFRSVRSLTEHIIPLHTPFRSIDEYFDGYRLGGDRLAGLEVLTTIVTSRDDPLIDVEDFATLPRSESLALEILPRGGHCGYIVDLGLSSWLEDRLPILFGS